MNLATGTQEQLAKPLRLGDQVTVGARIANQAGGAPCDISNFTVRISMPNPDGSAGTPVTLARGIELPAWTSPLTLSSNELYTVNLDDGVFQAPVSVAWSGVIHGGSTDQPISGGASLAKLSVTRPRATLDVSIENSSGKSPLTVTIDYALSNVSPSAEGGIAAPGLVPGGRTGSRELLTDPACGAVTYLGGDEDSAGAPVLDAGETWRFRCVRTFEAPGTYSSLPSLAGASSVDGRPWPQLPAGSNLITVLGSDLTVDKWHQGDLLAGGKGKYWLRVTNGGNQESSGTVTVADQLPAGLRAVAINGEGWDCDLASLSCNRNDQLKSGSSFPDVILRVAADADPPSSVVNTATVAGGGEPQGATSNNADSDPTIIRSPSQPEPPKGKVFSVVKVTSRANGTASLRVAVPAAGRLLADDARAPDLVQRASRKVRKPGVYGINVEAGKALKRQIRRTGKARKVPVKVTFVVKNGARPAAKLTRTVPVTFSLGQAGTTDAG